MGCFNVSCALSGLTIHDGDPCYFVPLIPDSFIDGHQESEIFVCSNEGSQALFKPAFLPIKGKYNDYGRLANPEINSNTDRIEKHFNTTIDKFLNDPTSFKMRNKIFNFKDEKMEEKDIPLSGCFIHSFAYDAAIKYSLSDKATYGLAYSNSFPVGKKILEYIGLKAEEYKEIERYKYVYRVNGEEKYVIQSDNEYSHIAEVTKGGFKDVCLMHSLNDFQKKWKELTGNDLKVPKEAKTKFVYGDKFDKLCSAFKEEKRLEELKSMVSENIDDITNSLISLTNISSLTYDERKSNIISNYKDDIINNDPKIKQLMCELHCLKSFMYLNCKMFMPTLSGPQGGEINAEEALLKASMKFVRRKKTNRK